MGKTYWKVLQRLCEASGVLPASFILTEGFYNIEQKSFTSGGSADLCKATYNGQSVMMMVFNPDLNEDLEGVHKVRGPIFCTAMQSTHVVLPALGEGSCRMEMVST